MLELNHHQLLMMLEIHLVDKMMYIIGMMMIVMYRCHLYFVMIVQHYF
jgi:hypothetical protein